MDLELSGTFVNNNRKLFELCLSLRKAALEPSGSTAAVLAPGQKEIERELIWRKTLQAFSAKADRTFCAVLILCAEGFTEDAAMLARSLVELDVSLRYVSVDPQARVMEMIYEADREYKVELQAMAKIRGPDQELKQAIEEGEKRLIELERESGIEADRWKKKTLWQKMKDTSLEDHYFVFRKFSGLIHPNPNELMPYIRSPEINNQPFEVDSAPRGENLDKVLVSAAAYFADVLLIMKETAGLDTSELIGAHARLKEHFERAAESTARQRKAAIDND